MEILPGKTIENLLEKNKAEIYSARYALVERKGAHMTLSTRARLLGQKIGKQKNSHIIRTFFLKKQLISSVGPVCDFTIIMQKVIIF